MCWNHIFSISFPVDVMNGWKATKVNFSLWYPFIILSSPFLLSPSSFSSESYFSGGDPSIDIYIYIYLYNYIKRNLYGWRCLEVNNLASCWLAAGLSVGEEEEGKNSPSDWHNGMRSDRGRGHRGRREAKRRRANTTNGGEIVSISRPKWDGEGERKSHRPSFLF